MSILANAEEELLSREIVHAIIDEFRDCPTTLLVCSLVSRAWVHRSQQHLFRHLNLRFSYPGIPPSFLDYNPYYPYLRCLTDDVLSNPELVSFVQHLSIDFRPPCFPIELRVSDVATLLPLAFFTKLETLCVSLRPKPSVDINQGMRVMLLRPVIEGNSALRELTLDNLVLTASSAQMLFKSLARLECLECLTLSRITQVWSGCMQIEKCVLKHVKRFCWSWSKADEECEAEDTCHGGSIVIENLLVLGVCMPMLEILAIVGSRTSKNTLDFVRRYAGQLKKLTIEIPVCPDWDLTLLKQMSKLTSLEIILPLNTSPRPIYQLRGLQGLMNSSYDRPSTSLEDFHVHFKDSNVTLTKDGNFAFVDKPKRRRW